MSSSKYLVVSVAALGYELVTRQAALWAGTGLSFQPLKPVFPAVTCTAQASFRTGLAPAAHGMVCNGVFNRELRRTAFWEQAAALLPPSRIWESWRGAGRRAGVMFWQQSLGEPADLVLSPAPVHKHHGGMIQDCYSQPPALYPELVHETGRGFDLKSYWGPLAGVKSTRWITDATLAVLRRPDAPELLLTYLPHLDYALQKYGAAAAGGGLHPKVERAASETAAELLRLVQAARAAGYEVLVFGDYAITDVHQPVFPNRALRRAGWFRTRQVQHMSYPDLYTSTAFAMTDHQVAHVYVQDAARLVEIADFLRALPGVAEVRAHATLNHPRAGELVLVAAPGAWFAYPWWDEAKEAPDYATHVDIHSKIGFDPCELFWGWPPPFAVSLDAGKVRGSHGRDDQPAAWAATFALPAAPADLADLGRLFGRLLSA